MPSSNSVATNEDTRSASVSIGASDINGDSLPYAIKAGAGPKQGNVSFDQASGTFTQDPAANTSGRNAFVILVSDGRGGSVEQNAFVNVRSVPDAPVAQNFSVFVEAGTNFNRIYSINELVSDPDSDALQFVSVYGLYRLANIVDNKLIMKDLNGAVDIYYTVSDELFETTGMIRLDYYFN